MRSGHAALSFKVAVAKHGAKLTTLTVELPSGMSFVRHRVRGKLKITGVTLTGAQIKALSLSGGHLVITLRHPVSSLGVKIAAAALKESRTLKRRVNDKKLKTLQLTVITRNTRGTRTTIHVQIRNLGL